jgi:2-polyprenyl-3-methyl-5-hydroxy-6-metoxy-1,4-benzoquinol methylase
VEESDYLLTNSEPETADRFDGLEQAFDPVSIGHLERLGVGVGARCLEIGAGSGSIARWLAGVVGPAGRVVAADLDTRWIRHDRSPQLEVHQLDVVHDPIPDGPWDLVHERLVLQHVPERLDVLDRLVAAGLQAADLDRYVEVLADPDTVIGSSVLISAWGRRPPAHV